MIEIDISIVSIFITTKQKTIESAELDFSIVSIVFNSQSENYCNYNKAIRDGKYLARHMPVLDNVHPIKIENFDIFS